MYLKGDISRRQLLNRMKYFGIYDGLVELNDNQLTEVIGSFVEQLKHLDVDVDDVCLVNLHNYWKDKTYCNDGFTLEVIPEELNRFYFGKAPLDVSNQGFYVLRDISYISKKAYGLK